MSMVQSAEPVAADPHADPMIPRIGRVVGHEQNLSDVWTLTVDMGEPFAFAPGQFNMLTACPPSAFMRQV
jgi:NAD(P)H-flavin reductase